MSPRPPSTLAALVLALAGAAPADAWPSSPGSSRPSSSRPSSSRPGLEARDADDVLTVLARGLGRTELARALHQLGPQAAPDLLAALAGELALLELDWSLALCDALRSHPRAGVLTLLAEQVGESVERRQAALRVLDGWAGVDEVALLFDLTGGSEPADRPLLSTFETAIGALHARFAEANNRLAERTKVAPLLAQDRVLRAVRAASADHSAELLVAFANGPTLLAQAAVRALGDLWAADAHRIEDEHLETVRGLLRTDDVPLCSAALVALGQAQDTAAAGRMIELLGGDSPALARDAHWALRSATSLEMAPRQELWAHWHARGTGWWTERSELAFEALASGEPTRIEPALREIAEQRLGRRELADEVAGTLDHAPVRVAVLCAATLGQLRAANAVPALLARVDDPSADVRRAVRAALSRLTDIELGPEADARAWRDALAIDVAR